MWKGGAQWNSDNPNAGKNFDINWQGEVLTSGGTNGNTVSWNTHGHNPSALRRRGWVRDTLQVGERVTMSGDELIEARELASQVPAHLPGIA